jgi:dTDP-D-glucose 4,6-dehydratase
MGLLVTGGAGFIGSNFIRYLAAKYPRDVIVNYDKLTYAGNPANLEGLGHRAYRFIRGDICDPAAISEALTDDLDTIVNFAAESHVDRSIANATDFIDTNIRGTQMLLEKARQRDLGFVQISCYDEATRALTRNGFKNYWEIATGDRVLSLNRQTGQIEEKEVEGVIVQDYSGEMVHFKSNRIDLLVTPNHAVFFSSPAHPDEILVQPAADVANRAAAYIPRGNWRGIDAPTISIPDLGEFATSDVFYAAGVFMGDGFLATQKQIRPNKTGLARAEYLEKARDSRGRFFYPGKIGNLETTTQTCHRIFFDVPENDKARGPLETVLDNLDVEWTAHDGKAGQHVYFSSELWSGFFEQLGVGFANKHIPHWMLDYDVRYLRCLFDGLIDSDGTYSSSNGPIFSTSSRGLLEGICELGFKLGLSPRFSKRKDAYTVLSSGRVIRPTTDAFMVHFRRQNIGIGKDVAQHEPYSGKVWCLKVRDNKNFIVEREGTMMFCGNTDEVYGSIDNGSFREQDTLSPSSPYSASKAAADLICLAYHHTYGLRVKVTRSTNNMGPYQFPEKLIPLHITNALRGKPLPLYGDGLNIRDWIHVQDNCEAIDVVTRNGKDGEIYNIGAKNERTNLEVARAILHLLGKPESLIQSVENRLGHDRRYSVDISRIKALGWEPRHTFEEALRRTVEWYKTREDWWRPLVTD